MPRKGQLTFVPAQVGNATLIPMDQIPEDVKLEAEEVYENLKNADGRIRVEFDTVAELNTYAQQLNSYCIQRAEDNGGPLRFRRSPTRGLPKTVMDFRITDPKTAEEEDKAAANEAAKAATAAVQPKKATTRK